MLCAFFLSGSIRKTISNTVLHASGMLFCTRTDHEAFRTPCSMKSVAITWDFKYLIERSLAWKMFKDLQELGIRKEIRAKEPWSYRRLVVPRFDVFSTRKDWLSQLIRNLISEAWLYRFSSLRRSVRYLARSQTLRYAPELLLIPLIFRFVRRAWRERKPREKKWPRRMVGARSVRK